MLVLEKRNKWLRAWLLVLSAFKRKYEFEFRAGKRAKGSGENLWLWLILHRVIL